MFALNDYEIIENKTPMGTNKVIKRNDGLFIPWMCWENYDWVEYAELASIAKE